MELVNRHEEIEARFERRRNFLRDACARLNLNRTREEGEIDALVNNVLAGKELFFGPDIQNLTTFMLNFSFTM